MKFLSLIFKNVRRNLLRSLLTGLGTIVLVVVVTLVWSVLKFLDDVTAERSQNLKAIVTERWQVPSQMPLTYAATLSEGGARNEGDIHPLDSMTWQFVGGSLDPDKRTRENSLFAFALEPIKLATMMEELDSLPPDEMAKLKLMIEAMNNNRQGIILGKDRLAAINKRVGDRFTLHSFNYKDINLEVEIIGVFPPGRYDNSAAIRSDYLNAALDAYQQREGKPHPMASKSLNLVWLKVPDKAAFAKISEQITSSPLYSDPAVKIETMSSGISTFMEAYRDIIWGARWLLSPAVIVTLSLVIANAISISVRQRRTEIAVMKVLGYRPLQIMTLVLGEALFLGVTAGLISAVLTYGVVNYVFGGIKIPIGFFPAFYVPLSALWWGLAIGTGTSLAGSLIPAWTAQSVKVSEVFSKVA